MSKLIIEDDFVRYYTSMEDVKDDGYFPVKVTSPLCFFKLIGKRTVMIAENIEPIAGLNYAYFAENKYYVKEYRGWDLETMYFYRPSLTFSGQSDAVEVLHARIKCGDVHLLLTNEQVGEISAMLLRLYSSYYKGEGKVPYKIWLELLDVSLRYEDYKANFSNQDGFKTSCKLRETAIVDLWKRVKTEQKPI